MNLHRIQFFRKFIIIKCKTQEQTKKEFLSLPFVKLLCRRMHSSQWANTCKSNINGMCKQRYCRFCTPFSRLELSEACNSTGLWLRPADHTAQYDLAAREQVWPPGSAQVVPAMHIGEINLYPLVSGQLTCSDDNCQFSVPLPFLQSSILNNHITTNIWLIPHNLFYIWGVRRKAAWVCFQARRSNGNSILSS